MSKKNNNQIEEITAEEKKKLDATRIFLIVFAAVAFVGILATVIFAILPAFKKDKALDYLKDDLSDYVNVPKNLYTGYTVEVELPAVSDKDIEYEIIEVLCANKIYPDTPVYNVFGSDVGVGDIANIYYRGYTEDSDGKKTYFDGGCNFDSTAYALEIGSGSFIPGFEYNLIGANQNDYATLTKLSDGAVEAGDLINLQYSVYYADGQASLAKTALVDLSDPDLDEKWGKGFTAYLIGKTIDSTGKTVFSTGSENDEKLTVDTIKNTDGTDIYFDMSINAAYRISEGDRLTVEAYFPYNYSQSPELAGKTAFFEVYIKSTKDYSVPEFNDEFITEKLKSVVDELAKYEGETLVAKYREYVREKLQESYEADVRDIVEGKLWDDIVAGSTYYKLPEDEVTSAYNSYVNEIQNSYVNGYSTSYASVDEFARAYLSLSAGEDWKAVLRSDAEYSIKQKLAFYYIIRVEDLVPGDEDYQRLYDELLGEQIQAYLDYYGITEESENYELKVETAKNEILSQYGESYWRESVIYEYAIDYLIDRANVIYKK